MHLTQKQQIILNIQAKIHKNMLLRDPRYVCEEQKRQNESNQRYEVPVNEHLR